MRLIQSLDSQLQSLSLVLFFLVTVCSVLTSSFHCSQKKKKKEVEEQFDRDFVESLKMLSESCSRCIRVAETFARIEDVLNEGLRVICNHFQETASAKLALTCGKNDLGHNEAHLLETLAMVDSLLAKDTHDDGFEVVATGRSAA